MGKYQPDITAPGAHFANVYAARKWLENERWHGRPKCPGGHMGNGVFLMRPDNGSRRRLQTFRTFKCKVCERQFTATTGTIFHGVRQLHKWLAARELLIPAPEMSGRELARRLGVSRKTAAAMKRRMLPTISLSFKQALVSFSVHLAQQG